MFLTEIQMDTELDKVQKEIMEKVPAAEDIMCSLSKQFTICANNIHPPEKQQSVLGWATSESQGPVGAPTFKVLGFGNSVVFLKACKRSCDAKQSQGCQGWVEAPLFVNNPWFELMVFKPTV